MREMVQFVVEHGYVLLFCWLFLEQAALPVPSIPLLLACGALARDGRLNPVLIVGYGLAACLLAAWIGWKFVHRRRFLLKLAVARITADELLIKVRSGAEVALVDLRNKRAAALDEIPDALRIPAEELGARHSEIPRDRDIIL